MCTRYAPRVHTRVTHKQGTSAIFNATKRLGFVALEGGSKDVFASVQAGMSRLKDDQKITLDIEDGRDGRESGKNIELG